ncbi:hypothetical protein L593_11340 [Salinarchaeum sp. Harcht-Bsk1]|nr:hypothetical protein L593_11340 [Salinarchaeum sp. Harcht-Bsk1]
MLRYTVVRDAGSRSLRPSECTRYAKEITGSDPGVDSVVGSSSCGIDALDAVGTYYDRSRRLIVR